MTELDPKALDVAIRAGCGIDGDDCSECPKPHCREHCSTVLTVEAAIAAYLDERRKQGWDEFEVVEIETIELSAFERGKAAGKHEAAMETEYGSFHANIQAVIAAAREARDSVLDTRRHGPAIDSLASAIRDLDEYEASRVAIRARSNPAQGEEKG